MFKRSASRPRARLSRSSSSSPRIHQRKGCFLGYIGGLLLLCTVAFLHAKLGSSRHDPSDGVHFERRSVIELLPKEQQDRWSAKSQDGQGNSFNDPAERSNLGEDLPRSSSKDTGTSALKQLNKLKSGNDSFVPGQDEYDQEDDEDEKLDDDTEADVELETDEMEDLENPGDTGGEGVDDMDEDEESEKDEDEQLMEDFEERKLDEKEEKTIEKRKEEADSKDPLAVVQRNASEVGSRNGDLHQSVATEQNSTEKVQGRAVPTKHLYKLGGIKTVPRWDPLEGLGTRGNVGHNSSKIDYDKDASQGRDGIIWDHLLGVARRMGDFKKPSAVEKSRNGADERNKDSLYPPVGGRQGSSNGSSFDSTQIFSSDDEPLDQAIRERLEEVKTIEDALLLRIDKGSLRNGYLPSWLDNSGKKSSKGDTYKKDRSSKAPFDPLNPANNPLLQDPDTSGPNGLSTSDKAILKALRKASVEGTALLQEKSVNTHSSIVTEEKNSSESREETPGQLVSGANGAERSILEVLTEPINSTHLISRSSSSEATSLQRKSKLTGTAKPRRGVMVRGRLKEGSRAGRSSNKQRISHKNHRSSRDTRKWGFFQGIDPFSTFSEFLEQFLMDSKCSLRVFMAWTTPPWTYTVRYQRGLESLLHFHPEACVVVFSESIELNFFTSFVEDGFKVAVVVPNLEELLEGTPVDIFASVWLTWRQTDLFHIHYTELLRLAALYKYGGVYMDTDIIVLKPLDLLHNTVGAERVENQTQRVNGAIMAFDKSGPFLLECLSEFTATYDDQLLEFNGAGLLTRVADRILGGQSKVLRQLPQEVNIEPPHVFFPLSPGNITRYFLAPFSQEEQCEQDQLLKAMFNHSHAFHFWNQLTAHLVPQVGSLVERVINHRCTRCHEYL